MSRSGYCDDYYYEGAELYRGAVDRAIHGKRGQRFLREMAAALDAMPVKELIAGELVGQEGCCAIGAVCLARGLALEGVDPDCPRSVGHLVGIARSLAAEIEYINDEDGRPCETPAARWSRVRMWVSLNIK